MASQSAGGQKKQLVLCIPAGVTEVQYRKVFRRQQLQAATHRRPPALVGDIIANRSEDNTRWAPASHGITDIDQIIAPNQRSNSIVGSSGSRYLDDSNRGSHQRYVHTSNTNSNIVREDMNHLDSTTAVIRANSILDSAALQADMSRRYDLSLSLPLPRRERRGRGQQSIHQRSTVAAQNAVSSALPNICGCCKTVNEQGEFICCACGYYLNSLVLQHQQAEETLAQRRGLVPPIPKLEPLTPLSWHAIEASISAKDDPDSSCPICMESFSSGCEVLLSCSHIFHQTCLRSFENFLRDGIPSCPLCRSKSYQKKTTALGTLGYQKACVRTIQRFVRGFLARRAFKVELRLFHRSKMGDEGRRKRFFETEFHSLAAKLSDSIDNRSRRVDSVLRSMDHTIHESQQLDLLFDHMLQSRLDSNAAAAAGRAVGLGVSMPEDASIRRRNASVDPACSSEKYADQSGYCSETNINWIEVFNSAVLRCPTDCAICMLPIHCSQSAAASTSGTVSSGSANRRDVLLSCSHLFHENCILSFERFLTTTVSQSSNKKSCPVCRSSYTKRLFRLPARVGTEDHAN